MIAIGINTLKLVLIGARRNIWIKCLSIAIIIIFTVLSAICIKYFARISKRKTFICSDLQPKGNMKLYTIPGYLISPVVSRIELNVIGSLGPVHSTANLKHLVHCAVCFPLRATLNIDALCFLDTDVPLTNIPSLFLTTAPIIALSKNVQCLLMCFDISILVLGIQLFEKTWTPNHSAKSRLSNAFEAAREWQECSWIT